MTPRETLTAIAAATWRAEEQTRRDISLAWHTAALMRSRRMPTLKSLLGGGKAKVLEGAELERRRSEHAKMVAAARPLTRKARSDGS